MENNLENKAKIFALYWGQNVVEDDFWFKGECFEVGYQNNQLFMDSNSKTGGLNSKHLLLKSIHTISIDLAIKVGKLKNPHLSDNLNHRVTYEEKGVLVTFSNTDRTICARTFIGADGRIDFNVMPSNIDHLLRSEGFALGYLDCPVDKQIEYGWVVIKQLEGGANG